MSYIVPGDIPKNCIACPCGYETEGAFRDECSVLAREYEKDADAVRPNWCPLVEIEEPHGRLIDANKLEKGFKRAIGTYLPKDPTRHMNAVDGSECRGWTQALSAVQKAKTVIEAEEEAEE